MNLPGLDPAWRMFHRSLHGSGAIRPWSLAECRAAVGAGESVLVVATTALGDSLLCTPLLQTLSERLGPERVQFLVRDNVSALYERDPRIGRTLAVRGKFRGFTTLRKALLEKPCRVALIANCSEPDLIPWLWWCGVKGFLRYRTRWAQWPDWFANRDMMRRPGEPDYATGHAIENNLAMAEALGLERTTTRLSVEFPEPKELPDFPSDRPLVLIHPGASRAEKCWPLDRWAAVAEALHRDRQAFFAVTGGTGERQVAGDLVRLLPAGSADWAGRLTLIQLAAMQRKAALFLSGDTGPYHLAVAVGCPTVTLFAPRDRGSSTEACGPFQADPARHRALQTEGFNVSISALTKDQVLIAARASMTGR